MDFVPFHDGNIARLIHHRPPNFLHDIHHNLQMHSSLIQRLSLETELEINIWRYSTRKLLHCIETGHTSNIYDTKLIPETSDELVASGSGDCEVRVFNISHFSGRQADAPAVTPYAHFQCHTKRVKKLAVEAGNPNVVWSASEDGTLRQHDFREVCSCPHNGPSVPECRSVLLDLRCGKKRSLFDPPNGALSLRSCDISLTRPHLILVGGRRMLPPLSCRRRFCHPPCVNYFCPMHLSESAGRSHAHLTHVAFSPNGEEVVISYSGEHVYLFDVNQGSSSGVQYSSGDVEKLWSVSPILNGIKLQITQNFGETSCTRRETVQQDDRCRKLLQTAERCLKEGTQGSDYYHGIELCNEVLDGHGCITNPILKHDCLCIRSALLLKRKWKNDAHMALRDLNQALRIDSSYRALFHMSEALVELGKHKHALDFALAAQLVFPSSEVAGRVITIKEHLAADEVRESNSVRERTPRSLDLQIYRRTDFAGQGGSLRHPCPSSTVENKTGPYKPEATVDMKQRFIGHCNMGTGIKQAVFLGQKGEYIASGSDDGRWFIWEKKTGRLIKILLGDEAVVNCIQSHPFDTVVATCGSDKSVKIWTPSASVPSMKAGGIRGPDTVDVFEAMELNQSSLSHVLVPVLPSEILERIGSLDSFGGSSEGDQCTQS